MTHDPCRYNCCIPPSSVEAVARFKAGLVRRKRELLELIKDSSDIPGGLIVPFDKRDALEALISDGLVVETPDGLRPHP